LESLVGNVAGYLVLVVVATAGQIIILLGPCLLLTFLMSMIAGAVQRLACRCMGVPVYLGLFGWLGTAVHELGHAVFHLLFGHRIVEIKLFDPDPRTGTLGYVKSLYKRHSPYQRIGIFFAGIGPILFGTLVIYVSYLFLVQPDIVYAQTVGGGAGFDTSRPQLEAFISGVSRSSLAILGSLFDPANLLNWKFYLFVYIAFAVGSSIQLSGPDIEGAISGFSTLVVFLLLFNLGTIWLGNFASSYFLYFSQFYGFFYAIMIFVLVLNLLVATLLYTVIGLIRTR
jgi:hypothetical protein